MLKSMIAMPRSSVSSSFCARSSCTRSRRIRCELLAPVVAEVTLLSDLLDDEGVEHVGGSIGRWGV